MSVHVINRNELLVYLFHNNIDIVQFVLVTYGTQQYY